MVGPELSRRLPYYEGLKLTIWQGLGGVSFLGGSILANYGRGRPHYASLPRHLLLLPIGLYVGKEFGRWLEARRNLSVTVIEDYICKHPEDFPVITPKKYKDVLLPWTPLR